MNADELRKWREASGLSQARAAEALGVKKTTLLTLEYGRNPSSGLWPMLAVTIGLMRENAKLRKQVEKLQAKQNAAE